VSITEGTVLKEHIVLSRELGRGAMGVVWAARHRGLDAEVAVKVLHAEILASDEARERFKREARAVARIDSPHVVRIFDMDVTTSGQPFIVMELLRGCDLKERISESGPLSIEDTATLVRQCCAALGRAHALGVVHRDLKPANLFLADGGDGIFLKVVDFGIAKIASNDGLALTSTDAMVGTPYYMSPEQFVDARSIDARSDLWSVAVVLYAALTGTLPFLGETIGALALQVHSGEFTRPSEHRPELGEAIDAWFKKALAPDREKRFQSTTELAESFCAAVNQRAPSASSARARASSATATGPADPPIEAPSRFVEKVAVAPTKLESTEPAEPLATSPSYAAAKDARPAQVPPNRSRNTLPIVVVLGLTSAIAAGYVGSRFGASQSTTTAVAPTATSTPPTAGSIATTSVTGAPTSAASILAPPPSASVAEAAPSVSSAVTPRPAQGFAGAPLTEGELRSHVAGCWASHGAGKPAGVVTVHVASYWDNASGGGSDGPYDSSHKVIAGVSAFKSCVASRFTEFSKRIPPNPKYEETGAAVVRTTVSLPGSVSPEASGSASP
jgi:serine/threonine protein kinase